MSIGIGVNAWVWISPFTSDTTDLIHKAAKMGFDYFEIPVEDPSHFEGDSVANALKEAGIKPVVCGAFGSSRDLTHEDPQYRQESLDYIAATLKLCNSWGATTLAGPMYSAVGKRRQISDDARKAEFDLAVVGLKQAAKLAEDHGVNLAIEPLNRFETDLINTVAKCVELVEAVDSPNVGIHLDTFHMHIEEKSQYEAVKLAGAHIKHVHVCENDRGEPGTGLVDWAGFAKGIKEVGYSGPAVIESFTPECVTIAAAAAIWRKLAPSQDQLASGGLAFLKNLLG